MNRSDYLLSTVLFNFN